MGIVDALGEDLVEALHDEQLLLLGQIEKAILSDELEDGRRVRHQEPIPTVMLEKQSQTLLWLLLLLLLGSLLIGLRCLCCCGTASG